MDSNSDLVHNGSTRPLRILLVTEYIAPVNRVASIRWTKIGKYLAKQYGCIIDVITNKKDYVERKTRYKEYRTYSYDDTLANDAVFFNDFFVIDEGTFTPLVDAFFVAAQVLRAKVRGILRKGRNDKAPGIASVPAVLKERTGPWAFRTRYVDSRYCAAALKKGIEWSKYDVVISTFGPRWTHYIAEQIKAAYPEIIWLADYRDALFYSAGTFTRENVDFAKDHTSGADCITVVSEDEFDALFLPEGQKRKVVPNGFDPEELESRIRRKAEKFYIAYTGTLYSEDSAQRDLTPLFCALSELIRDDKINPCDIEVIYCGKQGDMFEEQISPYPLIPFSNRGFVSRKESLEIEDKASLLVLCTWNTQLSRGIITGKVFEYFASKVPILTLCSGDVPNSKLGEMLERSNTGFCYEEAQHQEHHIALLDFIREKYLEWKADGMTHCETNWDYVQSFGHDKLAEAINYIIQDHAKGETR